VKRETLPLPREGGGRDRLGRGEGENEKRRATSGVGDLPAAWSCGKISRRTTWASRHQRRNSPYTDAGGGAASNEEKAWREKNKRLHKESIRVNLGFLKKGGAVSSSGRLPRKREDLAESGKNIPAPVGKGAVTEEEAL